MPGDLTREEARLPLRPGNVSGQGGASVAPRLSGESLDQPERDRRGPAGKRRPRTPGVELAPDEHRPCGADLGGQRRVALGRAHQVVRALLAVSAGPPAFELAPHML